MNVDFGPCQERPVSHIFSPNFTPMFYKASTKQFPVDDVAATLYPDDAPTELKPVMCVGDGNSLFQTFSIVLFGDEDHHTELCMRSICELAKNEKQYLRNNYLHDIKFMETSEKNPSPRWDLNP